MDDKLDNLVSDEDRVYHIECARMRVRACAKHITGENTFENQLEILEGMERTARSLKIKLPRWKGKQVVYAALAAQSSTPLEPHSFEERITEDDKLRAVALGIRLD